MTAVDDYKNWTPAAQERALQRVQELTAKEWRPFYCPNPKCDGKPHDSWDFNHAREDQRPPTDRNWLVWLLMSGRGTGKAMCLDTLLPVTHPLTHSTATPSGWKRLGDIIVGDEVFDEQGQPCTVVAVHEVPNPEQVWRITFSDGEQIDACGDHQWVTLDINDRKRLNRSGEPIPADWANKATITTNELAATVTYGTRRDRNHCIPLAAPLDLADANLLVDPWLLGYWMGNGHHATGTITTNSEDESFVREQCHRARHITGNTYNLDRAPSFTPKGLMVLLREIGVLSNKHIPASYLRASIAQRTALLQGLMDSDGHIDARQSTAEFYSGNERLARNVLELARSLNQKATLGKGVAKLNGIEYGPRFRVSWRPSFCPTRSPRKSENYVAPQKQRLRNQHRMIVSAEPIAPKPMRCLTVDSPNSMFLVGEAMIPTHNTRTGTEFIHKATRRLPRIALIAGTATDAREVMLEGISGILTLAPPDHRPLYEPSKKRLTWPNGSIATIFSAEEPDRLRGPEHYLAWLDEPAHWPLVQDCWDNLLFGLRLGQRPRIIATTTPKTRKWLKELIADDATRMVSVSTYKNIDNLSPIFAERVIKRFEGTRLGRQELHGELLTDVEGALWSWEMIEDNRLPRPLRFDRIVVGIDPAGSHKKSSDETGIVVSGNVGDDGYVLDDVSGKYSPSEWARKAKAMYDKYSADAYVVERNFGGDLVKENMRNHGIEGRIIETTSSRGKELRAEPIVGLYEQGRVHHCGEDNVLADLELQQTEWVPGDRTSTSPDRVDALVFSLTEVMKARVASSISNPANLRLVG